MYRQVQCASKMTAITLHRIYNVLAGCAYGDAFGMPTEGMSQNAIHLEYPDGITQFLPSINHALTNRRFAAASITDDTLHSLLLIDALFTHVHDFSSTIYLDYLTDWYSKSPIANQVIGPSTLKAIQALQNGRSYVEARFVVSNGAIMKIFPIGLIAERKADILDYVCRVTMPTHASHICITSAAIAAYLVSRFARNQGDLNDLETLCDEMISYCEGIGFDMPTASLQMRIHLALRIADENLERKSFLKALYDQIGCSINCIETLPCVLSILRYTNGDIYQCASLCASLGGDTDTIGAITCSICGALGQELEEQDINILDTINHISLQQYAEKTLYVAEQLSASC